MVHPPAQAREINESGQGEVAIFSLNSPKWMVQDRTKITNMSIVSLLVIWSLVQTIVIYG